MTSSASASEERRAATTGGGVERSTPPPASSSSGATGRSDLLGLSSVEAARRLAQVGPNELTAGLHVTPLRRAARSLTSPLMLVLLAASGVAAALGQLVDATIIVVTVTLSVALDVIQTARSTGAAERLRQSVVPPATVRRDGHWMDLPRAALVPGDLIRLDAGSLVPADAQLLEGARLHVQQSALTGESLPVEKSASRWTPSERSRPSDGEADPHRADLVFLGTSVVAGTATAIVTATGRRSAFGDIAARLGEAPPETAFDHGIRDLSRLLGETVVFLVLFLMLVSIAMHRDPLSSLLFAVALAVGLVPEFMPMITTLTLASGAVRMSRRRVIVKHLGAIQNLGGVDVLCSDKTGTLTEGRMSLECALDVEGRESATVRALAEATARYGSGVRNPLDDAILAAARPDDGRWTKVDEIPFDFDRRRGSVVIEAGGKRQLVMKGALESVLECCDMVAGPGGDRPCDASVRAAATEMAARESMAGRRVLAVAARAVDLGEPCDRSAEHGLTLHGLLAFTDPPLPDAAATIARLAADGVSVKIITGDDPTVTRHVCERTGLVGATVLLGRDLDAVSDPALGPVAEQTTVFARVSPRQKLRIILALKGRGHVVGYLGDGINDAPALHAADVGISVASAVDVAREAADVVLLERGLDVLHDGILEGRRAVGNIMKYLLMSTSSSFGNMFSMAAASLVIPFLPMLPTQILLNNFLYDAAQVGLPADRVDDEYLRKPHQWDVKGLRAFMVRAGLVSSVFDGLTFVALLAVFHSTESLFRSGWFVESLATQVLVVLVIRTARNPVRSRPGVGLVASIGAALTIGMLLPFSPAAAALGMVSLPGSLMGFILATTLAYLGVMELLKRRVLTRLLT
jgi:magnesium-translocating P-type ATPase